MANKQNKTGSNVLGWNCKGKIWLRPIQGRRQDRSKKRIRVAAVKSDPEQMLTHKITVAKTGNNEFSWKVQEGDLTTSNPGTETRSTKRIKKGGIWLRPIQGQGQDRNSKRKSGTNTKPDKQKITKNQGPRN